MSVLTREKVINIFIEVFPLLPLPESLPDSFYTNDLTDHFIVFKNKMWIDINISNINLFSGFTNVKYLIPAKYYFYYLPAILTSVVEDADFMDVAYEALLPNTKDFKINQKWLDFISILNVQQVHALIIYFQECKTCFSNADVMEVDLLIDMLQKLSSTDHKFV